MAAGRPTRGHQRGQALSGRNSSRDIRMRLEPAHHMVLSLSTTCPTPMHCTCPLASAGRVDATPRNAPTRPARARQALRRAIAPHRPIISADPPARRSANVALTFPSAKTMQNHPFCPRHDHARHVVGLAAVLLTPALSGCGGGDPMPTPLVPTPTSEFSQSGTQQATGRALDLAIDGVGAFVFADAGGRRVYSRAARLSVDEEGRLDSPEGWHLPGGQEAAARCSRFPQACR